MRPLIATFKIMIFLILCLLIAAPLQTLGMLFLSHSRFFYIIPTLFHRATCFIFRIKVSMKGVPPTKKHVIYVGNHLSYIDIPVIGGKLPATFIAKADVRNWPIFGFLARIAQTIFIERNRNAVNKCITDIKESLLNGRSLILFPEGTSSNGVEILPFKSSLFELFLNPELKEKLFIQPFTINLLSIDGKDVPQTGKNRDLYAWHGEMTLPPHLWALAKTKGAHIELNFHEALPAIHYDNRKIFAHDAEKLVMQGLAFPVKSS